jgi:hypothetical protein
VGKVSCVCPAQPSSSAMFSLSVGNAMTFFAWFADDHNCVLDAKSTGIWDKSSEWHDWLDFL